MKAVAFLIPVLALGACSSAGIDRQMTSSVAPKAQPRTQYVAMYGPIPDEQFPLPAMNVAQVDPKYFRQQVAYAGPEQPGTIVVDTQDRFLYLVQPGGMAMRYGIGVGREGMEFTGRAKIGAKSEWPTWTPTQDMIERNPDYAEWADGMEPGLTNPLGPRALYLYRNGEDTLFRIHGTSEPWSIGKAVSSGCVRLFNHDIIDLYSRVPVGARVVVRQGSSYPAVASVEPSETRDARLPQGGLRPFDSFREPPLRPRRGI